MPASATTQNYGLHIYRPGDTCNYLTTYNDDMTTIDAQMKANQTAAAGSASNIATLEQSVNALDTKVTQIMNRLNNIDPFYYANPATIGQGFKDMGNWLLMNRNMVFGCFKATTNDQGNWNSESQIFYQGGTAFIVLATWPNNIFGFGKAEGLAGWTDVGYVSTVSGNLMHEDPSPISTISSNYNWIWEAGIHIASNITYLTMRIPGEMHTGNKFVPIKKLSANIFFLKAHIS